MKWELSRFMMGGMQFGMLMLIIVFNYINNLSEFFNKYIFPLLVLIIVSGPVVHIFLRTYENLIKFILQDGYFKKAVFLLLTHNYLN